MKSERQIRTSAQVGEELAETDLRQASLLPDEVDEGELALLSREIFLEDPPFGPLLVEEREEEEEKGSEPALTDTVRRYLNEIGNYPLLTLEEEIDLALKIQDGQKAAEQLSELIGVEASRILRLARARVLGEKPLPGVSASPDEDWGAVEAACTASPERKRLYLRVREGERAREVFVLANLRLVVAVVKQVARKWRELDLLDLVAEGNRGLIRATETFDPRKGFKFSTYATWWIRQHAMRYVHTARRAIRLPVHQEEALGKIRAIETRLAQELKREPTADEIANALGSDWTASKVEELKGFAQEVWSLEEPVYRGEGEEDGDPYGSFLESRLPGPDGVLDQVVLRQGVERALKVLTEREEQVIRLRFGLDTERPLTLEEVAKLLGVTRERVRQIEAKALRRLRHNPASRRILRGLLNEE